jgi:hypothetical protein
MSKNVQKEKGFVALVTAIILTAILLIVTISLNQISFFTRGILLDSEYKERSAAFAEACVDVARLKLANDPTYLGDESIDIGVESCKIRPISSNTIETTATSSESVTNLRVEIDPSDISIVSWDEVVSF